MQKGVVALIVAAGLMLSAHRPLSKGELDTARVILESKVQAVEKKIERLSQQVQMLNKKVEMLDRRLAAIQKHFNIELSPQVPEEAISLESEQQISTELSSAGGGS
jgi:peptidoglycan hydrolase CwlO-like protein